MKELLVILFSGIFTSTILPSDFVDSEENLRNSPPEIQQIGNQSILEDQTFIYNVIVSDDDDDTIQYFLNIDGNGNGSINQQGLLTIVPNLNFNGIIQLEVTVSDGTETDSEIFDLEVSEVNDDPILEFINNVSYLEDESQMITVNATDVDSNDLFYDQIRNVIGSDQMKFNTLLDWEWNNTSDKLNTNLSFVYKIYLN